ncbi:MAG: hypothetical protein KY462_12280 [Actinobacteria bacterium]|nr:hypothetical protein [Actinomycetota bacterium]
MVVWIVLGLAAIVVAVVFGAKWVLAPLLGVAIYRAGTSMLRGMAAGAGAADPAPQPAVGRGERTLYWCAQCGAELLLVMRGAATSPRHCGERMHERVELVRE